MLLDTPTCDFGWQAPDFTLSDPNGKSFTLRDQLGQNGLLIMFICNHCPYVQRIGEQLATDTNALMDAGTNVLAIMSNDYADYAEDSPENMLKYAKRYGWEFPYLVDVDQSVGQSYGAVCTPDFFGFNGSGELQYRGNMDELLASMTMIAQTGQGPRKQTPSMGCSIKWRNQA
jgi:peroxiredoxin